jgi:CHASE2 domain-containing sensor protein
MRAVLHFLKSGLPWAFVLALAMQFVEYFGWVASPEGKLLDLFLASGGRSSGADAPRFVAVEIGNKDYEDCFVYSPMDPRGIKVIVDTVIAAQPKVVGVDIITDSPQDDDKNEYAKLREYSNVVWAAGVEHSSLENSQTFWEWLTGPQSLAVQPTAVLGKEAADATFQWALPIYPRDEDLHVRRLPRRVLVPPGGAKLSWPSTIAEFARPTGYHPVDEEADELLLARTARDLQRFKLTDIVNCDERQRATIVLTPRPENETAAFRQAAKDAIVLIGGSFEAARDFYETWQGRTSGLEINVNAIAAELNGAVVSEMSPLLRFLLDILVGMTIFGVFDFPWESKSVNLRIAASLGGIGFALLIAAVVLYWRRLVWLSVVGIAIGMVLHVFIEIWKEDLQIAEKTHH